MQPTILLFTLFVLALASGCTTLLLQEDLSDRPALLVDGGLIGTIPGDPSGDRVSTVDPTVIMRQGGDFPGRYVSIQNRIDYELARHTETYKKYLITWVGYQGEGTAANTRIEFLNEDDEVVLRLRFTPNQLEVSDDADGPPPVFAYQNAQGNTHEFTVVLNLSGSNGTTSLADVTIREANGQEQGWKRLELIGDGITRLKTVRFRADAGGPYSLERLAVNAID